MRPGVPWSVKGIEPEAREAAKQAARRAGVTLGAWLNQVIMETGTDEVGESGPAQMPYREAYAPPQQAPAAEPKPQSGVDLAPVAEAVREVVQRVENSERRALDMTRRLEATVGQLAARIDQSEHDMDDRYSEARTSEARSLDPLDRKLQQLAERMERAERARGTGLRPEDARTIQTLEKAVNAVVDHLEATERRTDETLSEIRQSLATLSDRVETAEEESEREEAKKRARMLEDTLLQLASRMEKMEHGVAGIGPQAVEAALKAINEKSHAENQRATIERLQTSLEQMAHRLERTEHRTEETVKTFETSITSIARKLEDLDKEPRDEISPALSQRLEQMAQRLEHNEQLTIQAAQTVEQAVAGISDNLSATENRDREALTTLQSMIEKMTSRLGHLERETKAVKQATLSPQLNAGGVAAGFAPSGPGFPMPQFDAPPMLNPAIGGNLGPALNASDWNRPAAPSVSAPPPADTYYEDEAPPPYPAAENEGEAQLRQHAREPLDDGVIPPDPAPPPMENAGQRAANDFLAAARRAAQAAAQGGAAPRQEPYYAPAPGYAESPARFTAEDQGGGRRKMIVGLALSFLLLALMAGAWVLLRDGPAPRITQPAAPVEQSGSQPSAIAPEAPAATDKDPEASPEDAGAAANDTSAPASTTPPAAAQPAVPEEALVPAPRPAAPKPSAATPAGTATLTPTAPATAAPATPVETAPVEPARLTLMEAATRGDAAAQYELGQRLANGDGVTQDMGKAAEWFERAAKQDLAIAQYRLATQYEKGRGVPQDDAKARELYEKAAASGNVKAMHNLAVIHAEGRGTAQDFTTAAKWFGEAADYGLVDSQYNLAVLNERGLGVEKNAREAYKWLAIAAKGGDKGAAAKRDALAATMDAAELAKAKVAAETWRAKAPAPLANGDVSTLKTWDVSSLGDIGGVSTRDAIARTQALLNRLGYDAGSPDGLMGPRTRDAILDYQKTEGLEATGTVTPEVLTMLEARFG